MESFDLRKHLEQSSGVLNEQTREYVEGLFILARHWDPIDGEKNIKLMMSDLMLRGASVQEAAIDCYHFLKPQLFKNS